MKKKVVSSYTLEQIQKNEEGWLFYDAAWKTFKAIQHKILGRSVLDIGCGSGVSLSLLKIFRPSMKVCGFEGTPSSELIWKERNLPVKVGDISSLPFDANSFDTSFSSHVLEHLECPVRAIEESLRVTKLRVIHAVPTGDVSDKNLGSPHIHIFNRQNLRELMESAGCSNVRIENVEDVHMSSLIAIADKHDSR
jgi:SAM-dependent methyltransferase